MRKIPEKNSKAVFFQRLTYQEVLKKELAVMDLAAFCQCRDYGVKIRVFNIQNQVICRTSSLVKTKEP